MNNIITKKDYSIIIITSKYGVFNVLISNEDVSRVKEITWHFNHHKGFNNYYICGYDKNIKKQVRLHRYIMDAKRGTIVDHINRDVLDNRRENLRFVTQSESMKNRNSSAYGHHIGVTGIKYIAKTTYRGNECYVVKVPGCKVKRLYNLEEAIEYKRTLL